MIVTVTLNPAVDYTVRVGEVVPERVLRAESARYDAGGAGINVSQYLVALDAATAATGLLGGFTGGFVRDALADAPFVADFVDVAGATRLNTTILGGESSYKINQQGPPTDRSAVDAVIERVREYDPDWLVVGGSLPPGLDGAAVDRLAGADDWRVAVDVPGTVLGTLGGAGYGLCAPNREELGTATGLPVETPEECLLAARALRDRGFESVVATLGAQGALFVTGGSALHAAALPVETLDTTGAGDALLAGVLATLPSGDAELALRNGVAAATRVAAVEGTDTPSGDLLRNAADVDVDRIG